jgi:hypothetical protein
MKGLPLDDERARATSPSSGFPTMKGLPLDDEEGLEVIVLFREENKVSSRRLVSD